jgi:hypothetical protein
MISKIDAPKVKRKYRICFASKQFLTFLFVYQVKF